VRERRYVARQIATLLVFAKSTKDARLSAVLIDKAAGLKSRIDELPAEDDKRPLAPDILLES
jgi:hypothetical protein